jgi:BolA protein
MPPDSSGAKFLLVIVSDRFEGVQLLDRHRMVQDALKATTEIHAVTMKTWTDSQWQKKKHQYV